MNFFSTEKQCLLPLPRRCTGDPTGDAHLGTAPGKFLPTPKENFDLKSCIQEDLVGVTTCKPPELYWSFQAGEIVRNPVVGSILKQETAYFLGSCLKRNLAARYCGTNFQGRFQPYFSGMTRHNTPHSHKKFATLQASNHKDLRTFRRDDKPVEMVLVTTSGEAAPGKDHGANFLGANPPKDSLGQGAPAHPSTNDHAAVCAASGGAFEVVERLQ